jgi:biopolymer transport protein TolR
MAGGLMGGGVGSGRKNGRYRPMAEINVTPMVDVMLVLLIIFMVTAPLLTSAVNVDLPKTAAGAAPQDDKPLTISVNAQGQVFLQEEPIEVGDLVVKLKAISEGNNDKKILVRGDKGNSYGRMLEVMAVITQGGFTKMALLSDPSGVAPSPTTGTAPPTTARPASPAPAAPVSPAPRTTPNPAASRTPARP